MTNRLYALDTETQKEDEETGEFVQSLNARDFTNGVIIKEGRLTPFLFKNNPDAMFDKIIRETAQGVKEGHNSYFYAHNHVFDLASYGRNKLKEAIGNETIRIKKQRPLFAIVTPEVNLKLKCSGCKNEFEFKGKGDKAVCPHCNKSRKLACGYLLDTLAFFKFPLKDIGKMIGLEKTEMPLKTKEKGGDELVPYMINDAKIVLRAIRYLSDSLDKLSHRPKRMLTAGQVAMNFFKQWTETHNFDGELKKKGDKSMSSYLYKKGRLHPTRNHMFIRRAYRGARTECFQQGILKDITVIDLNSLYPTCMTKMEIPDLLSERRIKNPEFYYSIDELLNMIGVAKAIVDFPNSQIGYLPVRGVHGKGIYFPRGIRAEGTWTLFELRRAREEGYKIIEIKEAVVYRELPFNPFKVMVEKLYAQRKSSEAVMNFTIKLVLNSLYGKFAQFIGDKERAICHRADFKDYENKGFEIESEWGEEYSLVKEQEKKLPRFANPIISIYTTAYARDELYRHLKKIPFEDLCYCDTDSCMFKGNHLDKFKIGKELGEFKIEYENVIVAFVKEKVYQIVDSEGKIIKTTFAGITNRNLTPEQLWGKQEIENKIMYTINMGLRTGNWEKVGTFFNQLKRVNPMITKRTISFPKYYIEPNPDEMIQIQKPNNVSKVELMKTRYNKELSKNE
jgi:DNA-directed RNA polymerase subunit RPC12/RpoP